jgi:hypothetical protein
MFFQDYFASRRGTRLGMINQVLEETGLADAVQGNVWTVQGECATDPTLVDGRIGHGVQGRNAIMQALGIE